MASYAKQTPPGGEGKISIKVNTKGYGGRMYSEGISVYTNDPEKQRLRLTVRGRVNNFVTIRPNRVRMTGAAGDEIKTTVKVIPEEQYPFKILETKTLKENNIKVTLDEVTEGNDTEYRVTVENLKNKRARYYDAVILKTDSDIRPEIKISVYGNIFDRPAAGAN